MEGGKHIFPALYVGEDRGSEGLDSHLNQKLLCHLCFGITSKINPMSSLQQSLKEGLTVQERMKLFEAKDSKKI